MGPSAHKGSLTAGDRNTSVTGDQRFTPGPWKVHPYLAPGPHCKYRDVGPGLRAVCSVIGEFEKDVMGDEQEANARLIAAAPDMLADHAENARILGYLVNELQGLIPSGKMAGLDGCLQRSLSAIAKAVGDRTDVAQTQA